MQMSSLWHDALHAARRRGPRGVDWEETRAEGGRRAHPRRPLLPGGRGVPGSLQQRANDAGMFFAPNLQVPFDAGL